MTYSLFLLSNILLSTFIAMASDDGKTLFDFTTAPDLDGWFESSDTAREVGMSKASLVLQKTQVRNPIYFLILNAD